MIRGSMFWMLYIGLMPTRPAQLAIYLPSEKGGFVYNHKMNF